MRPVHYISIAAAIALIAVLYYGANIIPPPKKSEAVAKRPNAGTMPAMAAMGSSAQGASFDSILTAARQSLPTKAANEEINGYEYQIKSAKDSTAMIPVYLKLAHAWEEDKQLPVAAFYGAKAAKLEKSEKKLNFAAQFFLELMHDANTQSVQVWEAQEAISCLQRSLEINPNNDTTKMALAQGYIEGTGETMNGVQLLLGIVREKPANIPANLMLGKLAVQSGQYDKAIGRFTTVLGQQPENTEALYFMGEAYKGKGEKEKAIELFEKCKKIVNKPEFTKDVDNYINTFK